VDNFFAVKWPRRLPAGRWPRDPPSRILAGVI